MSKKTVLLIDDDVVLQNLVVQLLKTRLKSFEVVSASTGSEGLELAKTIKPSVIILDIVLQEESGWEVAETFKADPAIKEIPIIVASGAGSPFEGAPYIDKKIIAGYIRKPYDVDELVEAITRVVAF